MMQARILLITSKKLTKFGVKKIHQTRIEGFWNVPHVVIYNILCHSNSKTEKIWNKSYLTVACKFKLNFAMKYYYLGDIKNLLLVIEIHVYRSKESRYYLHFLVNDDTDM